VVVQSGIGKDRYDSPLVCLGMCIDWVSFEEVLGETHDRAHEAPSISHAADCGASLFEVPARSE